MVGLVMEATHGKEPDLVIATILHDAVEDCEVPLETIRGTFETELQS
jgi:(p)ppGpp synthase/HD superfamily hydrolase